MGSMCKRLFMFLGRMFKRVGYGMGGVFLAFIGINQYTSDNIYLSSRWIPTSKYIKIYTGRGTGSERQTLNLGILDVASSPRLFWDGVAPSSYQLWIDSNTTGLN